MNDVLAVQRRQAWDELEIPCFRQNVRWIMQVSADYFFETQLTEKETDEAAFQKTLSGVYSSS